MVLLQLVILVGGDIDSSMVAVEKEGAGDKEHKNKPIRPRRRGRAVGI